MYKFVVRIPFYGNSSDKFSDEILTVKSTFASTFIDSNLLNCSFYFFAGNHLSLSTVLGCSELQNTNLVALFPLAICFFANVTNFACDHMSSLQESFRVRHTWVSIRC